MQGQGKRVREQGKERGREGEREIRPGVTLAHRECPGELCHGHSGSETQAGHMVHRSRAAASSKRFQRFWG